MEYGGVLVEDDGVFGNTILMEGDHDIIIEELLGEGCWIEASENNLMMLQTHQQHYINNISNMPMGSLSSDHFNHHYHHHHQTECSTTTTTTDDDHETSGGFVDGKRWWIGPRANPGPTTSVKERLVVAVGCLKDYYTKNSSSSSSNNNNNNVLIQIWVPPLRRRSPVHYLQQLQQESSCSSSTSVPVSVGYPNNPNMSVHVRFFRSHEYPRHQQQQQQQQYESVLALPVFERGSGTCLGVLEFVMIITNQTSLLPNYRPQLDHLSNALEAVDFRNSSDDDHLNHNNIINIPLPPVKVFEELYEAAVNEVVEVMASVCKSHNLPLALTWAPCIQQGIRRGGGKQLGCGGVPSCTCLSTVDSACYVGDVDALGFQEACSEHHLYTGQGIVGTAFTTTKPCFAIDITAFSKAEYPLAHHANLFGLHAAVAIPLRSVYTGSAADFVLEFFLPKHCRDPQQQKHMLNSLSLVVQQACKSLHLHLDSHEDDHDHQFTFPTTNNYMPSEAASLDGCSTKETTMSSSCSWIAHMIEAQNKGKGASVSLEYLQEPKEEFKVTTCNWDREREGNSVFSEFGQVLQQQQHDQSSNSRASVVSVEAGEESGGGGRRSSSSSNGRKSGDKRRTKAEKTISLPVLRQYFAGSLKDAAKSIGVCPTTLKRICRQHGITRWPSRKIKKVGHSLKKLQLVIDSVQGAEGSIQIGSFYASFPELSTATGHSDHQSSMKLMHNSAAGDHNNNSCFYGDGIATTSLKSPPSACSQTHVAGITAATTINIGGGVDQLLMTTEGRGDAELLHASNNINIQDYHQLLQDQQEDTKQLLLHFNNNSNTEQTLLPPIRPYTGWNNNSSSSAVAVAAAALERGAFRVKATFADEKIRFSLQAVWGLRDLQAEIARRFNLNDMNNLVLKYLDDEGEWVVLSCDSDLEECKDLHTSSHTRTIRLSLFQASPLNLPNNFHNSNSSSPTSL